MRIPVKPFIKIVDFAVEVVGRDASEEQVTLYYGETLLKLRHLEFLQTENDMLKNMLDFHQTFNHKLVTSEVTSGNLSDDSYITLDKGSKNGVRTDMAVIFINGVVGRIDKTGYNYSLVETHSNMNFKIGVCDKEKKFYMIAYFYKKGVLKVENIQFDIVLTVGDTLYTSGFGRIFPENIPVGVVTKEVKTDDGERFYLLNPVENIHSLRYAFIVFDSMENIPTMFMQDHYNLLGNFGWFRVLRKTL